MNGEKNQARAPQRRNAPAKDSRAARRRRRKAAQRRKMILIGCAAAVVLAIAILLVALLTGGNDDPRAEAPVVTSEPTLEPTVEPTLEPTFEPAAATAEPVVIYAPASSSLEALYEGGVRLTGATASGKMPYQIYVSKDTFTVAILGIDENGEYTRLLRTWRSAIGTGNKTRAGSYKIAKQYLWYEWSDGGYTPYTSALDRAKIRLHAPLHNKEKDWDSLWLEGYEQIGTKETQGCIRTTTEGAAWVYFNCKVGTEVLIANDSMYTSEEPLPLGDSKSDPTRPVEISDLQIPVTFFNIDTGDMTLNAGGTKQLGISGILPGYEEISHTFIYASGDESVATVSDSGLITAVAPGSCQILVMADDINKVYRIVNVTVAQ